MPLPSRPPWHRKHREEMPKLGASRLQLFALAVFAGAVLAPLLNPTLRTPWWGYAAATAAVVAAEGAALVLLRDIEPEPAPPPARPEETRP